MKAAADARRKMKRHHHNQAKCIHLSMTFLLAYCCRGNNSASAFIISSPMIVTTTTDATKAKTPTQIFYKNKQPNDHRAERVDLSSTNKQYIVLQGGRTDIASQSYGLNHKVRAASASTDGDNFLVNEEFDDYYYILDFLISQHQNTKQMRRVGRRHYLSYYGSLCFASLFTSLSIQATSPPAHATERLLSSSVTISDPVTRTTMRRYSPDNYGYSQIFPTLEYPFQHSTLVGLYFAASWCPMSTIPTQQLDAYYKNIILKPPPKLPIRGASEFFASGNAFTRQHPQQQVRKTKRRAPLSIAEPLRAIN